MSIVEDEIITKFRTLDVNTQINLLEMLQHEVNTPVFDAQLWLEDVRKIRHQIDLERIGQHPMPSATDILNELREERDEQILHSIGFGDFSSDSDH